MQWLARICVQRPVLASVFMLVILVLGTIGYRGLGVDQFPNVDIPVVVVTTVLPGAAPEEVETEVTDKIEGAVNQISGVDDLNSVSSEGISQVIIMFDLDKDTDVAAQEVRDKVNIVLRDLPAGIEQPVISKVEPDAIPVVYLGLRGVGQNIRDLSEVADKKVRRQLETIPGVGKVAVVGDRKRQINVLMDPMALRAAGLTALDVMQTLQTQNLMTPGGNLEAGPQSLTLRIDGRVSTVEGVEQLVIRSEGGRILRLADVARVEDGEEDVESLARFNGDEAVVISVVKQSGTNTIAVVDSVFERMEEIREGLPAGMQLDVVRDNSQSIRTSVHAVVEHLVLGAILASAVVLLFLGNAKSTLIAALSIPISIIGTFGLMHMQGYTLNSITLLALALAVGIVIDDAIVVLENIVRFIDEKKMKPFPAAVLATKEIGFAVLATTLSLMAVFIPVAFIGGIPGRFLKSFGYTMAFSIGISLIVSFSLTPMMSARMLSGFHGESKLTKLVDIFYRPIERVYMAMLGFCLKRRWVIALACVGVMAACVPVVQSLPSSFLPENDKAKFQVTLRAPEGTSAEETLLYAERVDVLLRRLPGVTDILTTVAEDEQKTRNYAQMYVDLVDPKDRKLSQLQIMNQARDLVLPNMPPELRINIAEVPDIGGGANQQRVQYILSGPEFANLESMATHITEKLRASGKAVDVDTTNIPGRPEVQVAIARDRAADLGVSVQHVASTLQMLVAGLKASTFPENGEEYEIRIRAEEQFRMDAESLALISVPSTKYGSVPLSSVVEWKEGTGPSQINRYGRQRQITLLANAAAGVGDSDVTQVMRAAFDEVKLPGYQLQATGASKSQEDTAAGFLLALGMAFIFMYLILAAQFESWLYPGIIMTSLPLTVPFAFFSLKLFGQSINMFSMLGLLVLFGVVKKNSILQVDHTNNLRRLGRSRFDSLMEANRDRLRPILMTTIAFVAGMIPLLTSSGIGAGMNKATAGIVVGGQTFSLLLTLLAVPVIHSFMDDVQDWFGKFGKKEKVDRGESELRQALLEAEHEESLAAE